MCILIWSYSWFYLNCFQNRWKWLGNRQNHTNLSFSLSAGLLFLCFFVGCSSSFSTFGFLGRGKTWDKPRTPPKKKNRMDFTRILLTGLLFCFFSRLSSNLDLVVRRKTKNSGQNPILSALVSALIKGRVWLEMKSLYSATRSWLRR